MRTCDLCGEEITGVGKRFCSPECSRENRKRKASIPHPDGLTCRVCGKPLMASQSLFCSKACNNAKNNVTVGAVRGKRHPYPLDSVPESPAEMRAHFRGIDLEDLDSVWVASVIEAVDSGVSISVLSGILADVRDRYRERIQS